MAQEKIAVQEFSYNNEDKVATQKDLRILYLEIDHNILQLKMDLESKISSIEISLMKKLGTLIVACNGILFALLTYLH